MDLREPHANRRHVVVLWALSILLILSLAAIVYVATGRLSAPGPQDTATRQPPATEQPRPDSFAGPYCYAGMPRAAAAFPHRITVLTNAGYLVGYCEARKDPAWVCYRLFKVGSFQAPPRPQGFSVDMRTTARVSQRDYSGSGYDRGHMAPNYAIALCYGAKAQAETFLMSNVVPQRPRLNRQVWEHLERTEIKDYAQRFKQVWVIDGPVFGKGARRLNCGVAVPTACYKIIAEEGRGRPRLLAFIMPQDVQGTESPGAFLTSVAEIERETGLDFFGELPDDVEAKVEAETAKGMW